jgi:hypothetical protein
MQDKEVYHASAVQYNEALALAAEKEAESVQDPVVKKWCLAVAAQHRFHLKRHRAALAKVQGKKNAPNEPAEQPRKEKTVAEEQAEFAAQQHDEEEHLALEGKV